MNTPQTPFQMTLSVMKFSSILAIGISTGIVSSIYSPIFPLILAALFAVTAIWFYASTQRRLAAPAIVDDLSRESFNNNVFFYVFYLGFFLSVTIPKSGKTVAGIPVTTANLVILITLACWFVTVLVFQKSLFHIPLVRPLLLFIIYGIASALIGFVHQNSRRSLVLDFVAFIGFIPLYLLACQLLRTRKHVHLIVGAVILSIFLVCGYGVLQKRLGFERVTIPGITEQHGKIMYQGVGRWNVIEGGGQKVYSTFQNGNIFGNHLATFIPFLGGILLALPSSKRRLLGLTVFLLSCYVLILTYSRGALVGTISGILALAFVAKKIRLKAIIILLLIVAVIGGFLYRYADRPELTRYDIRRISTDPNRFSAGRLERAKQVILGYYELPLAEKLFGIGFGGTLVSPLGWRFEYVDNLYLTLLFKMGAVGIALLSAVLIGLFWLLLKFRAQTSNLYYQGLINGGIAGLFASLVHNLADTLWFFPPLSANFWLLAGITMAIAMISARDVQEEPAPSLPPARRVVRSFNLRENRHGGRIPA
jgi:hypothetical protein